MSIAVGTGQASMDVSRVAVERDSIKRQSKELQSAAINLKSKLKNFSSSGLLTTLYSEDKNGSAFKNFALSTMRKFCKSYKELNQTLLNSDRLSNEGKGLLDNVQQLLIGESADEFAKMGLTFDSYTAEIKFDERKFTETINSDPASVIKLLIDKKYLGPVVSHVVDYIINQSEGYFFNPAYRQQSAVDVYV